VSDWVCLKTKMELGYHLEALEALEALKALVLHWDYLAV
jgi:hypothetical protein